MMKFGTETGSLINHVKSRTAGATPEVGMGATLLGWSDRNPATVTEFYKKGQFEYLQVQTDKYERVDDKGMSESQEYEYTRNPDGGYYHFRRKGPDAPWQAIYKNRETGRWNNTSGNVLVGRREKYHDFSF